MTKKEWKAVYWKNNLMLDAELGSFWYETKEACYAECEKHGLFITAVRIQGANHNG